MNSLTHEQLITALTALPQRELVDVLNAVFSRRDAELVAPEFEEGRLILVEAYRAKDTDGSYSAWDFLVLASPAEKDAFCTDIAPTQDGSCCGVVLASYAKAIICPLCRQRASAT